MIKYCSAFLSIHPNVKDVHSFTVKTLELYKARPVAQLLLGSGKWAAAAELAKYAVTRAETLQETQAAIDFFEILKYAARMEGDQAKYSYYTGRRDFYLEQRQAERFAIDCWQDISIYHSFQRHNQEERFADIEQLCRQIESKCNEFNTLRLKSSLFNLRNYLYTLQDDPRSILQACDELDQYYEEHKNIVTPKMQAKIWLTRSFALFTDGQYAASHEGVSRVLDQFNPASQNRLKALETAFLCCTHQSEFAQALHYFEAAHVSLPGSPENVRERWRLCGAYLRFVLQYSENKPNQFMELPDIQHLTINPGDYATGHNVAVLLLQVADLLAQSYNMEKADKALDVLENLKLFLQKHRISAQDDRIERMRRLMTGMAERAFSTDYKTQLTTFHHMPVLHSYRCADRIEIIPFNIIAEILDSYLQKRLKFAA